MEDPHTPAASGPINACYLPRPSSLPNTLCGIYFPTLQISTSQPLSPTQTVPPRSLVSHNSRSGLPHRRQDTQAGPLYLGRCCPSHTGIQSPASPREEQRQKVSENSTQQPHARSVPKRGKLSHHIKHKLLNLLCEAGWTTHSPVSAWCQQAIPKTASLKCKPGAGATFGINYRNREKVQEASHIVIST